MKPDTAPRSDLEIARTTIADAINRNASGIAATIKAPAPFVRNADYAADWREFWAEIVAPKGEINLDQVQRELSDYGRLLDAAPRVYMHATGGEVSKPLTDPSVVCDLIDEHIRKAARGLFDDLTHLFANGEGKPNPPGLFRDTTFKPPRGDLRVGLRPELPAGTWMDQHPDDLAVDRFAAAMKAKLAASRAKGRSGWNNTNDPTDLQLAEALVEHMTKGNAGTFEDVANFCMFLHQRGASPGILQHVALYTPATNFQRNTLLDALREVREALQFANESPDGPIRDTIWMMHRPETLFDFIDATLEGLFPEVTRTAFAAGRNMLYAGLFEDETEEERAARLALAHAMTAAATGKG